MHIRNLIYITFIWLALFSNLKAQEVPTLGYFNISGGSGKVYLSWQLNAGATCLGMGIQRSIDGQIFDEVGKIGGICGDLTKPISYSFTDENPPLNLTLYYRIELGIGSFSDTVRMEIIDFGESSFQVRPNPVKAYAKIYFKNESRVMHTLILSDLSGKKLGSISSDEAFFELNNLPFSTGVYIFTIRSNDNQSSYSGKLMILE